jgi:short subunit dehydrogenase-like uncharacterized protein
MITIFGATGYTGRLIAQSIDQSGFPFRIAGRSPERLSALSEELSTHPACIIADASNPATLPSLFRDTKIFINCAGPFTDLGEKVLAQAAVNGVHYLDITNELSFVYRSQTYSKLAQQNQALIIPACGFEVAFADFAARVLGASFPGPYLQANVTYHLPGKGSSIGTRRSAIRSLATSWITYRNGQWVGEAPGRTSRLATMSTGELPALSFPSSESVTFPAHLPIQTVSTWMTTSRAGRIWAPIVIPFFARLMRSILRDPVLALVSTQPPATGLRTNDSFEVRVSLANSSETKYASVKGKGAYDLTAQIINFAVSHLLKYDPAVFGVLPPSSLCDASDFFSAAQKWGVTLEIGNGA